MSFLIDVYPNLSELYERDEFGRYILYKTRRRKETQNDDELSAAAIKMAPCMKVI